MTNLVDSPKAPPRAEVAAGQRPAGAVIAQMLKDECGMRNKSILSIHHSSFSISRPLRSGGSLSRGYRGGLTLIEMLVALAITLVMMAAVVNLFANMSESIRNRRAAIETGSQLRQVRNRLAMDLAGATCRGSTWQDPAENQGYIEITEGEWSDKNPSILIDGTDSGTNPEIDYTTSLLPSSQRIDPTTGDVTDGRALGDWDDVLSLTVRSESDPFVVKNDMGTANPADDVLVESPLAEVIWFAIERGASTPADPSAGFREVHRKVLVLAPWLGPWANRPDNISTHYDHSTTQWVANTLGDLTKRENRSYHEYALNSFPHRLDRSQLNSAANNDTRVLDSSLAFDVRVFDPGAPLYADVNNVLEPNDYGWVAAKAAAGVANASGYGAYCDLGWGYDPVAGSMTYPYAAVPAGAPAPAFNETRPAGYHPLHNLISGYPAVYDTWSYHYENDGIDQDVLLGMDQGANGLDDDNANGVDDRGERETSPPYDVPLRGVKVILRVYEPDSRQIRESSVTHSFKQ